MQIPTIMQQYLKHLLEQLLPIQRKTRIEGHEEKGESLHTVGGIVNKCGD